MDESAVLRVRAFGTLEALFDGMPWPRPRRHDTEILWLFLLLHRDLPLRREHVAFSLWPDLPAEVARARLRGHVHWLERHLPPRPGGLEWVVRDRTAMRWDPLAPTWLDVDMFEAELRRARLLQDADDPTGAARAIDAAVAVYRGDLAPDIYAEWLEPHRQRLRAAFVDALHRAAELAAAAGRLDDAIAAAGRALAADPLSEERHRLAMALHARAGDRAAALRQLQACRDVLWSELGVEPAPETLTLGATIRDGAIDPDKAARPGIATAGARPAPGHPALAMGGADTPATTDRGAAAGMAPELEDPASPPPGNLPAAAGPLIGRERELAQAGAAVAEARLLTLVGPGGVGKSRLALAVADALRGDFPDGVWWIPLYGLRRSDLVPDALREAAGMVAGPDQGTLAAVAAHFATRRALLILDNCEHVIDGAADTVAAILAAGHGPRVIATSREALAIDGETVWPVAPLDLPPPGDDRGPAQVLRSGAVQLFVARVRGAWPGYDAAPDRLPAIAEICRQVDGLPLAIEIAASRVRMLSEAEIAARLRSGDQVLGARRRSPAAHHRSMSDTIDWSYRLLTGAEQVLLRRLAVFAGGFTLAAAEAVGADASGARRADGLPAGAVLDVLARLIDKSLVAVEAPALGGRRYRLLEVIRQFGLARLAEAGETAATERRHAEHFLAMVRSGAALAAGDQPTGPWFDTLDAEYANLRQVMQWLEAQGEIGAGLELAYHLNDFAYARGHVGYESAWLRGLLDRAGDEVAPARIDRANLDLARLVSRREDHAGACELIRAVVARTDARADRPTQQCALVLLAYIELLLGRLDAAAEAGAAARRWAMEIEDTGAIAKGELVLADIALRRGDLSAAEAHFLAADRVAEPEHRSDALEHNLCLGLGRIAQARGDYAAARAYFARGLLDAEGRGSFHNLSTWSSMLGLVCVEEGDYAAAIEHLKRGMAVHPRPLEPITRARFINNLGMAHFRQGDYAVARLYFEKALALKRPYGEEAVWSLCYTLLDLADLLVALGDLEPARRLAEEGVAAARSCGSGDLSAWGARVMAKLCVAEGDASAAGGWLRSAIEGERAWGGPPGRARTLDVAATAALALAAPALAARLAGAADGLRAVAHTPRAHNEDRAKSAVLDAARAVLGAEAVERELAEGRALAVEEAEALALGMAGAERSG